MIVFGCYTACKCFMIEEDFAKSLEFIELGIQVVEEESLDLGSISKGELYYEKWNVLEKLGRHCELVEEIDKLLINQKTF